MLVYVGHILTVNYKLYELGPPGESSVTALLNQQLPGGSFVISISFDAINVQCYYIFRLAKFT